MKRYIFFFLCLLCVFVATVYASEKAAFNDQPINPDINTQPNARAPEIPITTSDYYGYVFAGNNVSRSPKADLQPVSYKGGSPSEWGIGGGKYINNVFSIDAAFEYWGERFERQTGSILPGTYNNVIQAGGIGLSATALYNHTTGPFHLYVGLGIGYFDTGLLVTDPVSGLLTDINAPSEKWLPGYHFSLGLDYRIVDNHKLGLEVKRRVIEADFGSYTNGTADLGGTWWLIVYRSSER